MPFSGLRISTSSIDPIALQPLLNSRLNALDKNPGVRPIGTGETSRCLIANAILAVLRQVILNTSGCVLASVVAVRLPFML